MPANDPPDVDDLTDEERAVIDAWCAHLMTASHYDLLGVPRTADRKAIRDAYFGLSRKFHPDVFFGRSLGAYRVRIDEIFRAVTRAYDVLSNPRQRAGYDLHLASLSSAPPPAMPLPSMPSTIPPAPPVPNDITAMAGRASDPPPRPSDNHPAAAQARSTLVPPTPPGGRSFPTPAGGHRRVPSSPQVPAARPEGVVVPPPLRATPAPPPPAPAPPRERSSQPIVDPLAAQRAREVMARRLGGTQQRPAPKPAAPAGPVVPAGPDPRVVAEERRARVEKMVADAEEAQKRGDLKAALDGYKAAASVNKDDEGLKIKIEQLNQLVLASQVGEWIDQARDAARAGRVDASAKLWEKAWEARPHDATLLLNAAEVLSKKKEEHKRAVEFAQRALLVDPKLLKAYLILASIFLDAGLRASARGAIDNAAKIDPNNAQLKDLRDRLGPPTLAEQLGLRSR